MFFIIIFFKIFKPFISIEPFCNKVSAIGTLLVRIQWHLIMKRNAIQAQNILY